MRWHTGVVTTRESENTPCLSALDAQIICCIHFSAFTLFPHTFRVMFRFVLCMLLCLVSVHKRINYNILISFGSLVSFWSLWSVLFWKDIYIYLEISLQKIQFCENHPSMFWFTLLDIVNNDQIYVISKINGICLISWQVCD